MPRGIGMDTQQIDSAVEILRLCAELAGALAIALGVLLAFIGFLRALVHRHAAEFTDVRLTLGRYLALALEFQLAADILSTSVAPSWEAIGKLAATAVIRTGLNFFLTRELREAGHAVSEREEADPTGAGAPAGSPAG
ncbi:MAG TPA: DUF1622 domain-containing protein [Gemmatimonadaceae bacterium]|nr:DUF1622 domain-containing protein [Gemmatimonadaceae bacterium]